MRAALLLALCALLGACANVSPQEQARRDANWRALGEALDRGIDAYGASRTRAIPASEPFCSAVTHNCVPTVRVTR